jgi:hypothetical protein
MPFIRGWTGAGGRGRLGKARALEPRASRPGLHNRRPVIAPGAMPFRSASGAVNFGAKFHLTGQAGRALLTISPAPGWGAGGVNVGGVMGDQAGRIGWGSTFATAQHALPVRDLNADGTRSAGDGRIDQWLAAPVSLRRMSGRREWQCGHPTARAAQTARHRCPASGTSPQAPDPGRS